MTLEYPTRAQVSRRGFLGLSLATGGAYALGIPIFAQDRKSKDKVQSVTGIGPVTAKQKAAFEAIKKAYEQYAKLDDKKKEKVGAQYRAAFSAYLRNVLVKETKIVYDKRDNLDGLVEDYYYVGDPAQRQNAMQKLAGMLGGVKERYEGMATEQTSFYPEHSGAFGRRDRSGCLIVGHGGFTLATADEFYSVLDNVFTYFTDVEHNIKINGQEMNLKNRKINFYKYTFLQTHSRAMQVVNLLNGTRADVREDFKRGMVYGHLKQYAECKKHMRELEQNIADAKAASVTPEVAICTEAHDTYAAFLKEIEDRFASLGYEHRQVNGAWVLEKIKKQ